MKIDSMTEKLRELLYKKCNTEILEMEFIQGDHITADQIDEILQKIIVEYHEKKVALSEADIVHVKYRLENRSVLVDPNKRFVKLQSGRIPPWLVKADPVWKLWKPYEDMLLEKPISPDVIKENEKVIDSALDLSGNPATEGDWLRKGLIMGNVQSGKTMNFIGLINKAMDVGYHTIIILGGHMNQLSSQCQERVDEGVLGISTADIQLDEARASEQQELIGVGLYSTEGLSNRPHALTTINSDFVASAARSHKLNLSSATPVVFVIKKNVQIMNRLIGWLRSFPLDAGRDRPMLLIDDEADYASINTKASKNSFAATNKAIKDLLDLFMKRTYIGYTATPFANVFIPYKETVSGEFDDDLFPSDFMLKMPTPDNYVGQDFYFPAQSEDELETEGPVRIIQEVDDYYGWLPLKHKIDHPVHDLHPQLQEAILSFLCVIAIRILRGQENQHNTMLVNVSRFNAVQAKVTSEIKEYLTSITNSVLAYGELSISKALEFQDIRKLSAVFSTEFSTCEFNFEQVFQVINESAKRVEVEMVNGLAQKKTGLRYKDFDDGFWVIAVGGLKLSRGLTLEGLSVSFFLRNALAYDTLTQMCRWFGYRPGYKDLCRLYITARSDDHYNAVAHSIRELDNELMLMDLSNSSPRDFGLKVRSSEEALLVTAKNKMGTATEVRMHYVLWSQPYYRLRAYSDQRNARNYEKLSSTILKICDSIDYKGPFDGGKPFILKDVPYQHVIDIVSQLSVPDSGPKNEPGPVVRALKALDKRELEKPTVMLFSRSSTGKRLPPHASNLIDNNGNKLVPDLNYNIGGFRGRAILRTLAKRGDHIYSRNILVGDSDDLKHVFDQSELEEFKSLNNKKLENSDYRVKINGPVVVIYLLKAMVSAEGEKYQLAHDPEPTIMYTIHFPTKNSMLKGNLGENVEELDSEVTYLINEVLRGVSEEEFSDEDEDNEIS